MLKRPLRQIKRTLAENTTDGILLKNATERRDGEGNPAVPLVSEVFANHGRARVANKYGPKITPAVRDCVAQ